MKTQRLISSGVRSLGRNKARTFFMMLGTLIGVTALTVVTAVGQGTQQQIMDRMDRMLGGSSIFVSATSPSRGNPHGSGRTTTFTLADLEAIESAFPQVVASDPSVSPGGREVIWGGSSFEATLMGHSHLGELVWARGATRGAWFTEADVVQSARVALVGETVVRELFGGADPVGEQIRIGTIPFEVIGVLEPMGVDPHGMDKDAEIVIPVSTMMRRVINIDYIPAAKLLVDEGADLEATVASIEGLLRDRHSLGPDELNDFSMFTPVQVQQMIGESNRVFTVFLPLIAAISILVGGIVVANLMLMAVNERRSEIGLRKAVGARARDISLQFLIEAAAVTTLGGVLAIGLGLGVLQILKRVMAGNQDLSFALPWEAVVLGIGAAVVVGLIAGVAPARRAASLEAVQTLR